ncbi:MAG: ImmA/IrrE family metallo-endopeptidase [Planctomycetes bacterium]|nr:ImmA/IrrE family metallo-endopeptidase [Planctomycetota bacterium]
MAKTSLVNTALVAWAREQAGLTQLDVARRISITEEAYAAIEHGDDNLTFTQLRKLAHALKRPQAFFYLPETPDLPEIPTDFRSFDGVAPDLSPDARSALRDARYLQDTSRRFAGFGMRYDWKWIGSATPDANPEDIGKRIREAVGITQEVQWSWHRDAYAALRGWREGIEGLGVLTYQFSGVATEELSGFCLSEPPYPLLAINRKHLPARRCFSLLHELVHVLIATDALSNAIASDENRYSNHSAYAIERFCDQAAAAAIMPEHLFLEECRRLNVSLNPEEETLNRLASRFCASKSATLIRLIQYQLSTFEYFHMMQQVWKSRGLPNRGPAIEWPYEKALRVHGVTFVKLVLEAYHQDAISRLEIADHLGMKLKWQDQLERLVAGSGR